MKEGGEVPQEKKEKWEKGRDVWKGCRMVRLFFRCGLLAWTYQKRLIQMSRGLFLDVSGVSCKSARKSLRGCDDS